MFDDDYDIIVKQKHIAMMCMFLLALLLLFCMKTIECVPLCYMFARQKGDDNPR